MLIKHQKVSAKADPADNTMVGKTDWNNTHAIAPGAVYLAAIVTFIAEATTGYINGEDIRGPVDSFTRTTGTYAGHVTLSGFPVPAGYMSVLEAHLSVLPKNGPLPAGWKVQTWNNDDGDFEIYILNSSDVLAYPPIDLTFQIQFFGYVQAI